MNIHSPHLAAAALLLCLSLAGPAFGQQQNVDPNGPAVFTAINGELHMTGTIFAHTVNRFHAAVAANPGVRTLVMHDVPGSDDDDAALRLYRAVRNRGMNTHVPANGIVASGGVDLFCAGVQRTTEPGSLLLVHPWEDNRLGRGDQVPLSNSIHDFYRNYYREMGIGVGFYEHTLFAPRTNVRRGNTIIPDMHNVTQADRVRFNVVTGSQPDQPNPVNTQVTPQQLVGTWTFLFQGAQATMTIQPNMSFSYSIGDFQTSGFAILNGANLTLTDINGNSWPLTVQQAQANTITFADIVWTRSVTPPDQPQTLNLQGSWREVRTDNRAGKSITITGNNYVEFGQDGVFTATITLTGNKLTIRGNDGSVEEFTVQPDQGNRLNFADAQTGQSIQRFHWVRS
jgi:hypothetical protein